MNPALLQSAKHFVSFGVIENYFAAIFSTFPLQQTIYTKLMTLLGEALAGILLFFVGILLSFIFKKVKILQNTVHYKILKFPYFIALSPIFLSSMPSAIFIFFIGYKRECFSPLLSICVIYLIRVFAILIGIFW